MLLKDRGDQLQVPDCPWKGTLPFKVLWVGLKTGQLDLKATRMAMAMQRVTVETL